MKVDVQMATYANPPGGLPSQSERQYDRAIFTNAYAVIPANVMRDIVTSLLPGFEKTRCWVLARPLSGFAETFSQTIVEIAPGGGSDDPEPEAGAEAILFVTGGELTLTIDGAAHVMSPGGYAYLPPASAWKVRNHGGEAVVFHWIRRRYIAVEGIEPPPAFVTRDQDVAPVAMPDTHGVWATSRFVEPDDLRHDMHVNIVTFEPGGVIPFAETHVMEHGIYVLEGQANYLLNGDWVAVQAGDFMWLRAFCPQACEATGKGKFRYLLYKDVNRHMPLGPLMR